MANIFVRSPYIISINETGQTTTGIEIYLWNGTGSAPTTPQYTLNKAIPSSTNTNTNYDIAPYVREYLSHVSTQSPGALSTSFTNLATTQWCNVKIRKFAFTTALNFIGEVTHYAHDGYSFYESGANFDHGRFLLEQKEYFYNEDAAYAGEIACYLNSGEKVKYGEDFTSNLATINTTPLLGGTRDITTISLTGDYSSYITIGSYLYFTYDDGFGVTSWTGTLSSYSYNPATNTMTITPNFGGSIPTIFGSPSNTGRTVTAGTTEIYTVPSSGWFTIPRVSNGLTKLRIYNSALSTLYASWTFTPICEPKYTPVVIDFINKYGAWQREFFFKASKTNIAIESNDYNVMQSSASAYDVLQGQKRSFNTNGMETISVNSGYVNEDFSSNIKQLLMSERILVDNKPAICKTKSLELMKNINNHMINYSLEFEFAYNSINNVI